MNFNVKKNFGSIIYFGVDISNWNFTIIVLFEKNKNPKRSLTGIPIGDHSGMMSVDKKVLEFVKRNLYFCPCRLNGVTNILKLQLFFSN